MLSSFKYASLLSFIGLPAIFTVLLETTPLVKSNVNDEPGFAVVELFTSES